VIRRWKLFFKKGFYFIKLNSRAFFLITFFVSISLLTAWLDSLERKMYGVKPGVTMAGENFGGLLPAEVRAAVEELAIRYQKLAQEPYIDKKTGEIIKGEKGYVIDVEGSVKKIFAAGEGQSLEPVITVIYPRYTAESLQNAENNSLSYYYTWFRGSYERYTNISLAVAGINNTVVWPSEVFSFNDVVGPRTPERGYLPAPVILMGASNFDYGGGVCQVASTLYNAVLEAGLEIVERHPHSKRVSYVPAGKDATVDYGNLDLKFANNSQGPIIIKSGLTKGKVWVQIMGEGFKN